MVASADSGVDRQELANCRQRLREMKQALKCEQNQSTELRQSLVSRDEEVMHLQVECFQARRCDFFLRGGVGDRKTCPVGHVFERTSTNRKGPLRFFSLWEGGGAQPRFGSPLAP